MSEYAKIEHGMYVPRGVSQKDIDAGVSYVCTWVGISLDIVPIEEAFKLLRERRARLIG